MDETEPISRQDALRLAASAEAVAAKIEERLVPREEFERHRRNVRLVAVIAGVSLLILAAAVGIAGVAIFRLDDVVDEQGRTTSELATVAGSNRDLIDGLSECTTPTPPADAETDPHECYERSESRQRNLLADVFARFGEALDRLGDRVVAEIRAAASG